MTVKNGAYKFINVQNITTSGSSQQSSAFGDDTRIIRVATTQDTYIELGTNPTATTSSFLMPAGSIEFLRVNPSSKIAVIQVTTAGRISIAEIV